MHRKLMKKIYTIQRLQGVTVMKKDANDLIKEYKEDSRTCLFCDPPYPKVHLTGKNERSKIYKIEMLEKEKQIDFLKNLEGAKAKIFVCSYENELYNEILCNNFGWKCVHVKDTYKYMAVGELGQCKERVAEVGYVNYDYNRA
jgi:site-specific DNA-adenine methylase